MGGQGSGRKVSPIKMLMGNQQPTPSSPDNVYLPNYSGVQTEALKTRPKLAAAAAETDPIWMALSGTIPLNHIQNPTGSKDFNFGNNKSLTFSSVDRTPVAGEGTFNWEASGNFTGDLCHIHQHTGVPGAGTRGLMIETEHANITPLYLSGAGTWDLIANKEIMSLTTISGAAIMSGAVPVYYRDSQVDHDSTTNYVAAQHITAATFETSGAPTVSGAITSHIALGGDAHGSTLELSGAPTVSGAITSHIADTSDPHGATLTQTNLVLTSGSTLTDHDVSGSFIFRNILIGTEASPGAASTWPQGTIYLQYTP